jgi:hypothetical protein
LDRARSQARYKDARRAVRRTDEDEFFAHERRSYQEAAPSSAAPAPGRGSGAHHSRQLKHTPIRGTWADDAEDHWRALVAVVGHEVPTARKVPPTRKKKERPAVEEEPALVEPGWPLLPVTRGKTALIVGRAPKEPSRDRLETYLRLATLEWPLVDVSTREPINLCSHGGWQGRVARVRVVEA